MPVKIDKDTEAALIELRSWGNDEHTLKSHCTALSAYGWNQKRYKALNKLTALDMARVLLEGYEVEAT